MKVLVVNCSPVKNGATAEIVKLVTNYMNTSFEAKSICIDDYKVELGKRCRSCHKTAKCIQQDDVTMSLSKQM